MTIVIGKNYLNGNPITISCRNGQIESIHSCGGPDSTDQLLWVTPAFFDLQINGAGGVNFGSATLDENGIHKVVKTCREHGIGSFCPTLVTNSIDSLIHGFRTLARAVGSSPDLARAMPAFHLEGPYISREDGPRGAHPLEHVHPPNFDEFQRFQDAAQGRIRLVTLSPEYDQSLDFIEKATDSGLVIAIGHTNASPQRIRDAVSAGAKLSTHLGNGCHLQLPRHENYVWEQMATDELYASIIPDGHHLPSSLMKSIIRAKRPGRIIITSDASSLAGLPPGRYHEWGQEIEILPDGKLIVPSQGVLAGSSAFTPECVGRIANLGEVALREAVEMATVRPRELLGLSPQTLEPGMPADIVMFHWQPGRPLEVVRLIIGGVELRVGKKEE